MLLEEEKMLVTSIFSFSDNVFKRLLSQGGRKVGIVWVIVNPLPHSASYFPLTISKTQRNAKLDRLFALQAGQS